MSGRTVKITCPYCDEEDVEVTVTSDPGEARTWANPMGGAPPSIEVETAHDCEGMNMAGMSSTLEFDTIAIEAAQDDPEYSGPDYDDSLDYEDVDR